MHNKYWKILLYTNVSHFGVNFGHFCQLWGTFGSPGVPRGALLRPPGAPFRPPGSDPDFGGQKVGLGAKDGATLLLQNR